MSQDSKEWDYKSWYEANKSKIADSRKERYKSDPEYRAKVLERNSEYRAKRREAIPRKPPPEHKPRLTQLVEVEVDGKSKVCAAYHISYLAELLQRSIPTLYGWERNGILPKTPLWTSSDGKRERLYTVEMVSDVARIYEIRHGKVSTKDHTFYSEIRAAWAVHGIVVPERENVKKED